MSNLPTPDLNSILAPIHNNDELCSYETGRWPKPHNCGIIEATSAIEALILDIINSKIKITVPSTISKDDMRPIIEQVRAAQRQRLSERLK